jgi:predicted nucleotidyltransferase
MGYVIQIIMTAETMEEALRDFVERVTARLPGRVESITLYGSWARGTARPDSDVDVLVVVDRRDQALLDVVFDSAVEVDLERLTLLSVKVCPQARLEEMRRIGDPFLASVVAEGRTLWTRTSKGASATG